MGEIIRIDCTERASRAVIHQGVVFLSGMTADDRSQDISGQTCQVLAKVDDYLARAGSDKSRLLSALIWLKHIGRDFDSMNHIWNAWTTPGRAPARATAQCEMGAPDVLVEVIITAATSIANSPERT